MTGVAFDASDVGYAAVTAGLVGVFVTIVEAGNTVLAFVVAAVIAVVAVVVDVVAVGASIHVGVIVFLCRDSCCDRDCFCCW